LNFFIKQGAGTLTVNQLLSVLTTTVSAGTLQIGNGLDNATLTGDVAVNSGATLTFNTNSNSSSFYDYYISGQGNLVKLGIGTLTLTGSNNYSGGTTISAGTLQIGNGGAAGAITGNATIASGASLAFNRSDDTSFSGVISGAGSLLKQGAGALTLTGTSNYTGGTSINAGTLRIAGGGSLVSAATVTAALPWPAAAASAAPPSWLAARCMRRPAPERQRQLHASGEWHAACRCHRRRQLQPAGRDRQRQFCCRHRP